ncbi:uncharacterized protein LOC121750667 [Salvia splendens]|uniref:uncharacterized protein LOC121750667 n=1 Tax=Salvia splendens TaxID=180675 RepID=UPI001C262F81|nr:uncharacterized protein LOC121750667 [Salvia splendens]XP_042001182.1 uncharacterized protein LOC121750667 [Salvia splendens]XP_042001183.1 uncharacterized protein LOC121750667 [Salvia splendens]
MGPGVRFTVFKFNMPCFQIFSFEEVDLKDDTDLVKSGIPVVCCDKGIVSNYFPIMPQLCRVGGALFMMQTPKSGRSKLLWSAPSPPVPVGSTWTCCAALDSRRLFPTIVPLRDGRIFIFGGTPRLRGWIEIYDPQKGEFDRRNIPELFFDFIAFSSAGFEWDNNLVMVLLLPDTLTSYFPSQFSGPILLSYNVETDIWEYFEMEFPKSELEQRKIIYVGGNILFLIDQASGWLVYHLIDKTVVAKVDVMVEDKEGRVMQALYLGNNDQNTSWIFHIFVEEETRTRIRYAKVEVSQADYTATVQLSCNLGFGFYYDIYVIADEGSCEEGPVERERGGSEVKA